MRLTSLACLVALAACSDASPDDPERVPPGDWGGQHVALQVTADGASLEFDCAHARIEEPLRLSAGRFSVAGVYVREHGGPEREGEPEDRHPARFEGSLDGDRLSFSVHLTDEGLTIGSFSVVYGRTPTVFKCG